MVAALALASPSRAQVAPYTVVDGEITKPLDGLIGDAVRGRAIIVNRQKGLCLLCHSGPFPEERFQGNLSPSLAGAGSRSSVGALRLRMVDSRKLSAVSIMPAYHVVEGLVRVGSAHQGRPILTAQEIEDVVAFLRDMRD